MAKIHVGNEPNVFSHLPSGWILRDAWRHETLWNTVYFSADVTWQGQRSNSIRKSSSAARAQQTLSLQTHQGRCVYNNLFMSSRCAGVCIWTIPAYFTLVVSGRCHCLGLILYFDSALSSGAFLCKKHAHLLLRGFAPSCPSRNTWYLPTLQWLVARHLALVRNAPPNKNLPNSML